MLTNRTNHINHDLPTPDGLLLRDFTAAAATCVGFDPGPDPSWYPDPLPLDDDPEEDGPDES